MFDHEELFAAMGFQIDYKISHDSNGKKLSKAKQVARCGNAVCPPLATALVMANLGTNEQRIAA
jgi:DNA (cytosine-5)-methyltransferase 1